MGIFRVFVKSPLNNPMWQEFTEMEVSVFDLIDVFVRRLNTIYRNKRLYGQPCQQLQFETNEKKDKQRGG